MSILAIDPGSTESAYVELNGKCLRNKGKVVNDEMLTLIQEWYAEDPRLDKCVMAIEMPACYGMPVGKDVFETCRWVGIFQHAFGIERTHLVYRKARNIEDGIDSVCMHLCKSTRAKDPNVRQAIIDRYGGEDKAIGNKKCRKCKGKGWFGAKRAMCPVCDGEKWRLPPGPLADVSADIWAALAVAITFDETFKKKGG